MLSSNRKYVFIHGGFSYVSVLERYPKVPARPAKLAQKPLKKWIIRCLFLGELNLPQKKNETVWVEKKIPWVHLVIDRWMEWWSFLQILVARQVGEFLGFGIATTSGVLNDHIFRSDPTHRPHTPGRWAPGYFSPTDLCLYVSEFLSNLWGLKGGSLGYLPRG